MHVSLLRIGGLRWGKWRTNTQTIRWKEAESLWLEAGTRMASEFMKRTNFFDYKAVQLFEHTHRKCSTPSLVNISQAFTGSISNRLKLSVWDWLWWLSTNHDQYCSDFASHFWGASSSTQFLIRSTGKREEHFESDEIGKYSAMEKSLCLLGNFNIA